jgi:hypothetical protein
MTTPTGQRPPGLLPGDLREQLTRGLPPNLDEDLRWWIERFAEDVHARGYSTGYLDGWPSGAAHEERRQGRMLTGRTALDGPFDGPRQGPRDDATALHSAIDIPDAPP